MSPGLDGVRQAARERKQEQLTALLHHLNAGLLRNSFYALGAARRLTSVGFTRRQKAMGTRAKTDSSTTNSGQVEASSFRRVFKALEYSRLPLDVVRSLYVEHRDVGANTTGQCSRDLDRVAPEVHHTEV
jgi:hypothetical protein